MPQVAEAYVAMGDEQKGDFEEGVVTLNLLQCLVEGHNGEMQVGIPAFCGTVVTFRCARMRRRRRLLLLCF